MQSAIHLVQFETSERDSFSSVQDSERDSFGSVRYFRARFIWFSSGLQNAERDLFDSVRDFRA